MRILVSALLLITAGAAVAAQTPSPASSGARRMLSVGDPAPAFKLPGSDGRIYSLHDYRGKQPVVIAWFAKAFTSG